MSVDQIKCVVAGVGEDVVRMNCVLPHDKVELEVPVTVVPVDLRRTGTCVWFGTSDGDMFVTSREFEQQVLDKLDTFGDTEFEAWLNSLDN